jgi:hypothetical protein
MSKESVIILKPYPFEVGQKIFIDGGPRRGDWEVIGINDRKVKLRCPISAKVFEWNRFCYFSEAREDEPWPHKD